MPALPAVRWTAECSLCCFGVAWTRLTADLELGCRGQGDCTRPRRKSGCSAHRRCMLCARVLRHPFVAGDPVWRGCYVARRGRATRRNAAASPHRGSSARDQASTRSASKIYPRAVTGWFRAWRWVFVWGDAARVLRACLAAVERPPGGAVRPGARASSTCSAWCSGRRTSST